MTFSIAGFCGRTGEVGVAVATFSLACGARAHAAGSRGAIMSQGFASPHLGALGIHLLREEALSAPEVMDRLRAADPDFAWRQISLVDGAGRVLGHTGARTRPWSGQAEGRDCVACGNVLLGEAVVRAMVAGFESDPGVPLAERLLRGLEGARGAGGQQAPEGPLPERSAALKVAAPGELHLLRDLRVDASDSAIVALRGLYEEFERYAPYYEMRWRRPAETSSQRDWQRRLQGGGA
ncbi:MAG: DUF1028 domain-containing protein [Alphaproteobacteria bacterium]|nr:DUF1028 domain-containing protein [Alphaproteobacteria bacterium]